MVVIVVTTVRVVMGIMMVSMVAAETLPETLMTGMTIALLVYLQTLPWCNGQLQCRSSEY